MPGIQRTEVLDPKKLSDPAVDTLIDRLYEVHDEIFAGVSREEFAKYVVYSPAERTRIQVSYGPEDQIAGYVAMHAFRKRFRDAPCTVLRAEAGLRRAYRGAGSAGSFFASQVLQNRWGNRGAQFYLGCLVHPSSYTALQRDAAEIWPSPSRPLPEDVTGFLMELGEAFHLEAVDPARPLVRKVGWITRDTPVERDYWLACENPAARFFIEQNPGFVEGNGLLTLMPLDLSTLSRSLASWGGSRLKKSMNQTLGSLERTVLKPRLGDEQAELLLQRLEQIGGVSLDGVRAMGVVVGARYPVTARTVLFRAGDRGDALYVVVQGSLLIIDESQGGQEVVIDQVGPGGVVGEIALVTGQPRSATVRAATDAVLVRLDAEDLRTLFDAEPVLEPTLWRVIASKILGGRAAHLPALSPLSRAARLAWLESGSTYHLTEALRLTEDRVLVLAQGELCTDGPNWCSVSAPAVLPVAAGTELRPTGAAWITLLPPQPGG